MESKAKKVQTPVGNFPFPMNPAFTKHLDKCKNNEDLFNLVEENGFINPDAFTELSARHLVQEYRNWKSKITKGA